MNISSFSKPEHELNEEFQQFFFTFNFWFKIIYIQPTINVLVILNNVILAKTTLL